MKRSRCQDSIISRKNRKIFAVPLVAPVMIILRQWLAYTLAKVCHRNFGYRCSIIPQGITRLATFEREMVGVHSADLATIITSFVCGLVVHIVRYAYLGEYAGMEAHMIQPFFLDSFQRVSKAISYRRLAYFDGKRWC